MLERLLARTERATHNMRHDPTIVPPWFGLFGVVLAVILVPVVLWNLFTGEDAPPPPDGDDEISAIDGFADFDVDTPPADEGDGGGDPVAGEDSDAEAGANGGGTADGDAPEDPELSDTPADTVEVAQQSGGTVDAAAAAVALAEDAARGLVTGDFTDVPTTRPPPDPSITHEVAELSLSVFFASDDRYAFTATVQTTDGEERIVDVVVVQEEGAWAAEL